MDDLDENLLLKLRDNARAPVAELARALGLSRTTVQSRLARLERSGIITGYSVRLAEGLADNRVQAFVMLKVEPKHAADIAKALKKMSGVRRLYSVSGAFDLVADVEATSVAGIDAVLAEISGLKGVDRINTSLVLATKFDR